MSRLVALLVLGALIVVAGAAAPPDTCIVSGRPLGSMGDPHLHVHQGRTLRFCCSGCVPRFARDPAAYLARVAAKADAPPTPITGVTTVAVDARGFAPEVIAVPAERATVVTFARSGGAACLDTLVFPDTGIRQPLASGAARRISVRPAAGQRIVVTCADGDHRAVIVGTDSAPPVAAASTATARPADARGAAPSVIEIGVDGGGFAPKAVTIVRGRTTILRFHRTVAGGCSDAVAIPGLGVREPRPLPQGRTVDIAVTPTVVGDVAFSCPMDMDRGVIHVVEPEVHDAR